MAGYLDKIGKDIARWRASGLIDAATATALEADARAHHGAGISFGSILMILAATLFGAALLLAIAANWEAIPRLVRVGGIFAVLIVGYAGGAFAKGRGHNAIAEGLWLVAAVAFGGGIALIGQMYHLSGDEAGALFVWALGTAFAAAGLRSGPLTAGAVLLAASWMAFVFGDGGPGRDIPVGYLVFAAALWAISLWTASVAARHLILLSLMLFVVLLYVEDELLFVPMLLAVLSVAIVVIASQWPALADRVSGLGSGLAAQGLLGFIAGMSIVQAELYEGPYFLPVAVIVFAGIVGALLLAGRDNRALRWLAYAGFIFELGFVYLTLLDTMLGTAGFFFMAGVLLALLAWLISRVEKRLAAPEAGEGA